MRRSHAGLLLASLLVTAGLTACSVSVGGSDKIDRSKAEKFLSENIHPTPKSVTCPSGVKIVKGGTFACTITLADGAKGTITVHMTNSTGEVHVSDSDIHVKG